MRESSFQKKLIEDIHKRLPDAIILKNDCYIQGIPDLTVLNNEHWAFLECKGSATAPHRPNQDYYIQKASEWSFGAFVYPENKKEVLDDLQRALQPEGQACPVRSK